MLMPPHNLPQQVLLVYCLGGVVFWAARSMTPINQAFLGFTASALLPVALWMLAQGDMSHAIMAMMLFVFIAALAFLANNFSREFRETFALRYDNTELVKELQHEVQQHKQTENIARLENRILAMILRNDPLQHILNELNHGIESIFPHTMSSILLLDANGKHLHLGSAPSLPDTYNAAIEGVRIGPAKGSCGTAAYHNRQVIVSDIATNPLWENYRDLALSHGLRACWSLPIRGKKKNVLGTFALYHPKPHQPEPREINTLESFSNLASLTIEYYQMQEELKHLANHDTLTGLPNRTLLKDRLQQTIAKAQRKHVPFALLFIDLNGFKKINDNYGHDAGDAVLKEIGKRLRKNIRGEDTVARYGGDEFILLLTDTDNHQAIEHVCRKLIHAIRHPIREGQNLHHVGAAIGIAIYPEHASSAEKLIQLADEAMYRAKQQHDCAYCFCSPRPEA